MLTGLSSGNCRGGYKYYSGKNGTSHCYTAKRQADGYFYVWTHDRNCKETRVIRSKRKRICKQKALARFRRERYAKKIVSVGYIPKDRSARLAAFKRYAEARRKQGRDDDAAIWEMRAVALEQDLKDNPDPVTTPKMENEIAIERVEKAIRTWTRKHKLASTKLKKLNRKLTRLSKCAGVR